MAIQPFGSASVLPNLFQHQSGGKHVAASEPGKGERMSDEAAVRQVVETWMAATQRGAPSTILILMTDDRR